MFQSSRNNITSESLRIDTSMMSYEDIRDLRMGCYLVFNVNRTNMLSDPKYIIPPVINVTQVSPKVSIQLNSKGIPVVIISMDCSDVLPTKFNIQGISEGCPTVNITTSNASILLENVDCSKQYSITVRALLTFNGKEYVSQPTDPQVLPVAPTISYLVYILPPVLIFIVFIICLIIFVILLRICYKHIKKVTPKKEEWISKEKC
jgi:hypothetical protein